MVGAIGFEPTISWPPVKRLIRARPRPDVRRNAWDNLTKKEKEKASWKSLKKFEESPKVHNAIPGFQIAPVKTDF